MRAAVLRALGLIFAGLGFVGAFLPLLPTTPFLLLAGACFARSSPRLHRRMLESRVFGPYLRQWRRDRSVPPGAKTRAYVLIALSFGPSAVLVSATWQRALLVAIATTLVVFLSRLPTAPADDPS